MTDVRPGKQARLANLLKTADTTADPGTSELSGFACARVATPTNWRHVKKRDRDAEIVESGSVFATLSALAPAGEHRPVSTSCQAVAFRRREYHRRRWQVPLLLLRETV